MQMSRGLLLVSALLLVHCTFAVRVTNSHSLVRRRAAAFEESEVESEFPLCPSPDSDDQMECPKRNGICCSFEGRPTGRCCAAGETCTADDPPQCVAYAGMRHLDRLVEKIDTGLTHVDHLDEGDAPAILTSNKRTDSPSVSISSPPSSSSSSSKSPKYSGSIRDDKLELLRTDLESLEGYPGKYLNETEYREIEEELRTLAPDQDNFAPANNNTEESQADTLRREESEEAERKEKEIEYMKQRENHKDKLEDSIEAEVERENGKIVDNLISHDPLYGRYHHTYTHVVHQSAPSHTSPSSSSSSSSSRIVVDHVNMLEQQKRAAELKAKIAELEEPLKLQIEPDEVAVHALNYLKARLREIEEEGTNPTASHKNNAREFLAAIASSPKVVASSGCNSGGSGDCVTTNSATDDAPVAIATRITSFLPSGSLPTVCAVGARC